MNRNVKFITDLSSEEALDFLLKSEQYHNFELPEYFDFDKVLEFVKSRTGDMSYDDCIISHAGKAEGINVDILLNKDGKYAVRPLCLSNPYLYYFLAREICTPGNWTTVKDNFTRCKVPTIQSCALPVMPEKVEKFHKATTILNWWNSMEQKSIELSLKYRYMFVSDITNCYGSVNPQSIDWALSRKDTPYHTEKNHALASRLIMYLRELQQGRNTGMPQGSTVYDLLGELILSYSDLLLYEALKAEEITEGYYILRYRDDYRIFCNDHDRLEKISYTLQHVLETLNFRMNSSKTHITDSIITDSIKPDKLFYIFNTPIFNKKGCDFDGIQKHLLYILMFGRKFPNAGQLRTMLSDLDKRIEERLKPEQDELSEQVKGFLDIKIEPPKILENIKAMSAIASQIAMENMSVSHYALRIISRMVNSMDNKQASDEIVDKVYGKLSQLPNSTYTQLWLQNMTYRRDVKNKNATRYTAPLCQIVMDIHHNLWNNSWLKPELTKDFPQESIVNRETLAKVTPIITFRETRAYEEAYL